MAERDKLAIGIAAGAAVAAAGAAGAAAMLRRADKASDRGRSTPVPEALEEASGRGDPSGGPDQESRESGYDVKDAKVGALVKIIAISMTLMIVSLAVVFYVYARFDKAYQEPNADLTAEQRAPIVPPLPHLQAQPYRDIDAVLMQQTRRLTTFGWNGSDHKSAHIPIERAIQQVIGKPLDGPAQADAAGPKGSNAPQPATPAYNADIQQEKPANRVQGEGNPNTVTPSVTVPLTPETKP